jgi:nucleotide-binding universal stress UspA family protein
MLSIQRILVPTDFSDTAERALDYAIELAEKMDATVTVMHSYEIPVIGFPDGALVATANVASRMADVSRAALEATAKKHRGHGVTVEAVLRDGVVHEEIRTVADQIDADLIVIGTHGRRGLARAFHSGVAEHVIRITQRPVLAIHGPRAHA